MSAPADRRAVKLELAMREGRLASVLDVPLGRECGCVCPKCGEAVIAKNRDFEGRTTQMHFAHAGNSACETLGGETAPETALHLLAKEIVADGRRVMLPALELFPEAHQAEFRQAFGPRAVTLRSAVKEPWKPAGVGGRDLRPDIVAVTDKGVELYIEFRVSHPVPPEKAEAAQRERRWLVEIDLGQFRDWPLNAPDVKRFIQQSITDRAWLAVGAGFDLKERLLKASSVHGECPLRIPWALERGTCKDCPCRLSPPAAALPLSLRCTGHSRVTSRAELAAWERGETLPLPRFASAQLAADRRAAERDAQIFEIQRKVLELEHSSTRRARLVAQTDIILAAAGRPARLRKMVADLLTGVPEAAMARAERDRARLQALLAEVAAARLRLEAMRGAVTLKDRERQFRKAVMAAYQAGKGPVTCPHCHRPALGQFRGGTLLAIELCECLIPDSERRPDPATWARDRTRRLLAERIRPL